MSPSALRWVALFFVWVIHYGPCWSDRYRGHMDEAVNMNFVPSPEKLVALIDEIVTSCWPDKDDDQADYLLRLGFHQGEGAEGFGRGYGFFRHPSLRCISEGNSKMLVWLSQTQLGRRLTESSSPQISSSMTDVAAEKMVRCSDTASFTSNSLPGTASRLTRPFDHSTKQPHFGM